MWTHPHVHTRKEREYIGNIQYGDFLSKWALWKTGIKQALKKSSYPQTLFVFAPLASKPRPCLNSNPYSVCMINAFGAGHLFLLEFTNVKHVPKIFTTSSLLHLLANTRVCFWGKCLCCPHLSSLSPYISSWINV